MSECEYAGSLGAYHDGEIDAATCAALEQHLRQCASCAAELDRMRKLSKLLNGAPKPELSAQALHRFHAAADLAPSITIRRMAEALTSVAAAILVVCGVLMWKQLPAGEPAGPMPIWEASVLQHPAEPPVSSSEDQLAMWMVQDLSWENGHDQD